MTLTLKPRDPRIHVFSVSDGEMKLPHQTYLSQLDENAEGPPLGEVVGAAIDPTYAEVFAVADVSPMGLRAYLAQAHDIPEATLAQDAARLDALSGDVLVLAPRAVEGVAALEPRPELTHIGSYAPAEADNAPRELPRAAREPAAPDRATAPDARTLPRGTIAAIVIAALVLAAVLLLLL